LVIGLIFVSAVFPKIIVENLMLFLSIALVVVFVALLLWGFISGSKEIKFEGKVATFLGIILGIGIVIAVLWASGIGSSGFLVKAWDFLFNSSWSGSFWTNVVFVLLIGGAIAAVLVKGKSD
jgi:hypothetical protein